jgi:uncharacterized membrane protein YfhO
MKNNFWDFIHKHPLLTLTLLILTVGLICLWNFFSLEDIFVFTGLASDSYTAYMPGWFNNLWLHQDSFLSRYNFYEAAGNGAGESVPTDPVGFVIFCFSKLFYTGGVEGYAVWYFYSKFIFYVLGTGIFTFLWLRMLDVNRIAAISGGILAAFSGSVIVLAPWNIESYGFYTALYLYSFELLFQKKNPWLFVVAAMMFAGSTYFLYLHSFFLAVYILLRFVAMKPPVKKIVQTCIWVFFAGLIGLLMNLPGLYGSLMAGLETPRMEDVAFKKVADSRIFLTPEMLSVSILRLFANNIPGNDFGFAEWNNYLEAPALYTGIITLLVFPQIFQFLSTRKKIAYSCFLAFWFAVMLFPPLRRAIVLYAGDYYRYGIDFFFTFAMVLVAAQSISVITAKKRISFPLLLFTVLILSLMLWSVCTGEQSYMVQKPEVLYFVAVMMVLYVLLFCFMNFIDRQILKILMLSLVLFEVTVLTYSSFDNRDAVKFSDLELNTAGYDDGISEVINEMHKDTAKFYRTEVGYSPGIAIHTSLNCNKVLNYFTTKAYNSFNHPDYVRFLRSICAVSPYLENDTRWLRGIPQMPFIYSFMSSKYLIIRAQDSASTTPAFFMLADTVMKFPKHYLIRNNYVMPLGFTVDKYIERQDFDSLVTFTVTPQSAEFVNENLRRNAYSAEAFFEYSSGVNKMIGKSFASLSEIDKYVIDNFSPEIAPVISSYIYICCHENSQQLYSLLNCFIPNEGDDYSGKFQRVMPRDSVISIERLSFDAFIEKTKSNQEEALNITEFKQYYIKGNVSTKNDKFMVLTIPYDGGWSVKIDGKTETVKKCDIAFCGFELPAGNHVVELEYGAGGWGWMKIFSVAVTVMFYLAFVFRRKIFKGDLAK